MSGGMEGGCLPARVKFLVISTLLLTSANFLV